jgi:hypothetical protein
VVDEAVLLRLMRGEPAVAVGVELDLLDRLAGVERLELGQLLLQQEALLGLDLDVGRRAAEIALAFWSRTSEPRKMIRSLSSRW